MRAVVNGKLYDTENATLVHTSSFYHPEYRPGPLEGGSYVAPGERVQSLYETPNGNFFYIYEGPGFQKLYALDEKDFVYGLGHPDRDDIDRVIAWLESHHGTEVILERWPERVWAG